MRNKHSHSRVPAHAETSRPRPEEAKAAERQPPTQVQSVEPMEPEDAYLTGGSRSLQRRLLGLNVPATGATPHRAPSEKHPDAPGGLHATGSFTGKREKS